MTVRAGVSQHSSGVDKKAESSRGCELPQSILLISAVLSDGYRHLCIPDRVGFELLGIAQALVVLFAGGHG